MLLDPLVPEEVALVLPDAPPKLDELLP